MNAEHTTGIVLGALGLVGVIVFAAWLRSLSVILLVVFFIVLLYISFHRSRRLSEEEMIRRQDQAMGKVKDDPNEMARWVP